MQKGAAGGGRPNAVRVMQELSAEGYPAAMFAVGLSKLDGPGALAEIARDAEGGVALVEKAAAARFAPAMFLLALRRIRGEGAPSDPEGGLRLMQDAARRGSPQAQIYLGTRHEKGIDGLAADLGKAELLYRQCSYAKIAECQYNLGRVLLGHPDLRWRDVIGGVAWLELAGEGGVTQARMPAARARELMTAEQKAAVDKVKATLPR